MESKFYTPDAIAELLDMHPKTIRRYIREGKLKATKIGKSWRVSGHDLTVFTEGLTDSSSELNSQPYAKVSAVVDVPMTDSNDVMTMINFLTSVQNTSKDNFASINGQYIQQEGLFRIMLWGNIEIVQQLLSDIQYRIKNKEIL